MGQSNGEHNQFAEIHFLSGRTSTLPAYGRVRKRSFCNKKTSPQRCLSWPCGPDRGNRIFYCHEETTGYTMLCEMCSLHVEKDLIIHRPSCQ